MYLNSEITDSLDKDHKEKVTKNFIAQKILKEINAKQMNLNN